jgi:phage-related protein
MAVTYPTTIYGQESAVQAAPRLIRTNFGDGNQAVIIDGINAINKNITLVHPLLESSDAAIIRNFLEANIGQVVNIKNMMEDYSGLTTMNIIILGWTQDFDGVTYTFTVNGEKVFRSL